MCATLVPGACLLHLDIRQSPLLCIIPSLVVNSFRNLLQDALLPHFISFFSRFFMYFCVCFRFITQLSLGLHLITRLFMPSVTKVRSITLSLVPLLNVASPLGVMRCRPRR